MRAHGLSLGAGRLSRITRSTRRRADRVAVLVWALALAGGTALVLLPPVASAEECPNAAFRTGPSAHLPDCRAYEMVSPPFKDMGYARVGGISRSGLSMNLYVNGAFAGVEGYPNVIFPIPGVTYTTQRTAAGWVSTPDDPPTSEYLPYLRQDFTNLAGETEDDMGNQVTMWVDRGVRQPGNTLDFFMRRADRSIVDIGPIVPPTTPSATPARMGFDVSVVPVGSSPNGTRFFFTTLHDHWPSDGTEEGRGSLYEYLGTGNTTPLLVEVDNSGALISQCGTSLGGGETFNGYTESDHNAVSTDGNTVFFTAGFKDPSCNGNAPPVAELYARIDNGLPGAHTVAISEPSKEDCSPCDTEAGVLADAHFQGASEDGSKVFFTTTQPLLGGDTSENLYEYDFDAPAGERVVRVTAGDATVSNPAPGLVHMEIAGLSPLNSEDGSHVYFVATGALTSVPNGEGESAETGAENLYVFERGTRFPGGHMAFVARLSEKDVSSRIPPFFPSERWQPETTPDGRFLVFASERDLTPDDTSTARQIFEYDAQTATLVRVSIGQDGFNHNGNVAAGLLGFAGVVNRALIMPTQGVFESSESSGYWSHLSVSADGSYVFFQSIVGLTPQALNEKIIGTYNGEPQYANNVYEYHAGRVSLISDGQDVATFGDGKVVELLGTDASGSDVFFQTADQLVGQDTDGNLDIYDARIDGGFPAPALPQSCSGDACQGPLSGAPTLLSPGSQFQAGGNPPLAGAPAAKPKAKHKAKPKAKKRRPKSGKAGRGHAKRHAKRAERTVAGGRANRKAGRS